MRLLRDIELTAEVAWRAPFDAAKELGEVSGLLQRPTQMYGRTDSLPYRQAIRDRESPSLESYDRTRQLVRSYKITQSADIAADGQEV